MGVIRSGALVILLLVVNISSAPKGVFPLSSPPAAADPTPAPLGFRGGIRAIRGTPHRCWSVKVAVVVGDPRNPCDDLGRLTNASAAATAGKKSKCVALADEGRILKLVYYLSLTGG